MAIMLHWGNILLRQPIIFSLIVLGCTRIIFTGFVSNGTLREIFKNADAFIFPSLHEGFGIPVLESFYFKKPLLCSNTTSLPEIAGDAALLINPFEVDEIKNAMVKIWQDEPLRNDLIQKGIIQKQKFTWEKSGDLLWESIKKATS